MRDEARYFDMTDLFQCREVRKGGQYGKKYITSDSMGTDSSAAKTCVFKDTFYKVHTK